MINYDRINSRITIIMLLIKSTAQLSANYLGITNKTPRFPQISQIAIQPLRPLPPPSCAAAAAPSPRRVAATTWKNHGAVPTPGAPEEFFPKKRRWFLGVFFFLRGRRLKKWPSGNQTLEVPKCFLSFFFKQVGCMMGSDVTGKMTGFFFLFEFSRASSFIPSIQG